MLSTCAPITGMPLFPTVLGSCACHLAFPTTKSFVSFSGLAVFQGHVYVRVGTIYVGKSIGAP